MIVTALATVFPLVCPSHAKQRSLKAKPISFGLVSTCGLHLWQPGLLLHCDEPRCSYCYFHAFLWHDSEEGPFLITVMQQELIIRIAFCSKGQKLELSHFDAPQIYKTAGIQTWL